jgi:hypothetical protein
VADEKFYHVVAKMPVPPAADPQQVQADRPHAVDWTVTESMTASDPHGEGDAR